MTPRVPLFAVVIVLAALASSEAAPAAGVPLGLVLAAQGGVLSGGAPVSLGSMLFEGQQLELPAGGSLVFSLITTCEELSVAGPGRVLLSAGAARVEGATVTRRVPSPGCVRAERVALSSASQVRSGAVIVRGGAQGRVSPRGGFIASRHPTLRWDGPLADGRPALVLLERADGVADPLLELEVRGDHVELPAQAALVPGVAYRWSVEPAGLSPGPHLQGTFRLSEDAVAIQLDALRSRAKDAPSWLRVAFFCEVQLLEAAAADAYARALALDPSAEGARLRLVELDLPG